MQTPDLNADNLYQRLGLNPDAPVAEIKRAYHRLLRMYPPERFPEEFKRIREAYETLKDPGSRKGYDSQPDPKVRDWIELGITALGEKRYSDAERYFKQVLIQAPDLAFVRNHLGLSFLYQGKGAEAIAQYQRLIQTQPQSASLFGNLGHAFRIAGKMGDAERAFRRAIDFSDEDKSNYYLALADVYLSQNLIDSAKAILEKGIRADNNVDFEDLPLFTKLLEIELRKWDLEGVNDVVNRIQGIVQDDEQGRYAAWKFGSLAQSLIEAEAFKYAVLLSLAARRLMPEDGDYQALVAVSERLDAKDLAGANEIVQTHQSFFEGAWLSQLGPIVKKYCVEKRVLANMQPITSAPSLRTINTVGFRLYGARDYDEATKSVVATYYFVILFFPLIPLACYRVIPRGGDSWSFLGKVPFSNRERKHLWIVLGLLAIWIIASSSQSRTSSTYSPSEYVPATTASPISTPDAQVGGAGSSAPSFSGVTPDTRGELKRWIETEKSRLVAERTSLDLDESRIESMEADIQQSTSRLRSIKNDSDAGMDVDVDEYERFRARHNNLVEDYNALLQRLRGQEATHSSDVDALNQNVDLYNSRR